MPKVINNPLIAGVTGMVGKTIVLRYIRNQQVLSNRPTPRKSNSEKQQQSIDRFAEAQQYAKMILKDPGMKALYMKGINDQKSNAHTVASCDYLNTPEIHYVRLPGYSGIAGDVIRIKATDDFQVTSVNVEIKSGKGQFLEKGPAERYRRKPFMWVYKTSVANPDVPGSILRVTASDRPGNRAVLEIRIEHEAAGSK